MRKGKGNQQDLEVMVVPVAAVDAVDRLRRSVNLVLDAASAGDPKGDGVSKREWPEECVESLPNPAGPANADGEVDDDHDS